MDKLVVENLHLQYGDNPILKGVSMTLNPGEVVALLGASGSGKTTLLRSVAGLEQPSRGRITIGDAVLYDSEAGVDMPVEKRNLGLVFQSYALVAAPERVRQRRLRPALARHSGERDRRARQSGADQPGPRRAGAAAAASALRRAAAARGDRARAGVQPAGGVDGRAACPTSTPSCARKRARGCAS